MGQMPRALLGDPEVAAQIQAGRALEVRVEDVDGERPRLVTELRPLHHAPRPDREVLPTGAAVIRHRRMLRAFPHVVGCAARGTPGHPASGCRRTTLPPSHHQREAVLGPDNRVRPVRAGLGQDAGDERPLPAAHADVHGAGRVRHQPRRPAAVRAVAHVVGGISEDQVRGRVAQASRQRHRVRGVALEEAVRAQLPAGAGGDPGGLAVVRREGLIEVVPLRAGPSLAVVEAGQQLAEIGLGEAAQRQVVLRRRAQVDEQAGEQVCDGTGGASKPSTSGFLTSWSADEHCPSPLIRHGGHPCCSTCWPTSVTPRRPMLRPSRRRTGHCRSCTPSLSSRSLTAPRAHRNRHPLRQARSATCRQWQNGGELAYV